MQAYWLETARFREPFYCSEIQSNWSQLVSSCWAENRYRVIRSKGNDNGAPRSGHSSKQELVAGPINVRLRLLRCRGKRLDKRNKLSSWHDPEYSTTDRWRCSKIVYVAIHPILYQTSANRWSGSRRANVIELRLITVFKFAWTNLNVERNQHCGSINEINFRLRFIKIETWSHTL